MVKTKRISPNSFTNSRIGSSMWMPTCPAAMPANRTPALPRLSPRMRMDPNRSPATATKASMSTAKATGCCSNVEMKEFIPFGGDDAKGGGGSRTASKPNVGEGGGSLKFQV